jgi:hypothetical protein
VQLFAQKSVQRHTWYLQFLHAWRMNLVGDYYLIHSQASSRLFVSTTGHQRRCQTRLPLSRRQRLCIAVKYFVFAFHTTTCVPAQKTSLYSQWLQRHTAHTAATSKSRNEILWVSLNFCDAQILFP